MKSVYNINKQYYKSLQRFYKSLERLNNLKLGGSKEHTIAIPTKEEIEKIKNKEKIELNDFLSLLRHFQENFDEMINDKLVIEFLNTNLPIEILVKYQLFIKFYEQYLKSKIKVVSVDTSIEKLNEYKDEVVRELNKNIQLTNKIIETANNIEEKQKQMISNK